MVNQMVLTQKETEELIFRLRIVVGYHPNPYNNKTDDMIKLLKDSADAAKQKGQTISVEILITKD